jgi:hypothetical protein
MKINILTSSSNFVVKLQGKRKKGMIKEYEKYTCLPKYQMGGNDVRSWLPVYFGQLFIIASKIIPIIPR